ncbi:MAG: permease prefix domain 1-containing protein [Enterococcaceae bacterium]|jgi:hypothetical protein|nr:permease prefix domain 1-containing protein [Enterococcaceae bacterium]MCI1918634.1 permease prefix domain 1-containing protein [Enterococcaceae bacterium]
MDTIRDYLENLFKNVPQTPAAEKAKANLLATMEDHYQALIDEGKSENEAIGAVISEFGSIDELLEELGIAKEEKADAIDAITIDEGENYFSMIHKFALYISLGVVLSCAACASIVLFADSHREVLGLVGFFLIAALAVGLFVAGGMEYSKQNRKLNDRPLTREVREFAAEQVEGYTKSFTFSLIAGIFMCIISVTPIFLFGDQVGVSLFLLLAGLGSFLIIYGSITYNGFRKLADGAIFIADEDEPGPRASEEIYGEHAPKIMVFNKIYWPLIVVIYLGFSFFTNSWAFSWMVFPLAGVLHEAIAAALKIKH